MILQNKPTTLSINTPQTITLNVSELSSSISGTFDAYESNPTNWKVVEFIYKNDTQIKRLIFRLNKGITDYSLSFSEYSLLGNFECVKIRIEDYQADSVVIKRNQFASLFGSTGLFDIVAGDSVGPGDIDPPYILNVQRPSPIVTPDINIGSIIEYTFTFNEPVVVQGNPNLELIFIGIPQETFGTEIVTASYFSGSGTDTLKFRYIAEEDLFPALTDVAINIFPSIISLNGGTIKDPSGNNAVLTFPGLITGNFTFTNQNIDESYITQITAPNVNPLPLYNPVTLQRNQFVVHVEYSTPVVVQSGSPRLNITIGTEDRVMTFSRIEGNYLVFYYTLQNNDLDTDGVVITSLNLNGSVIKNAISGNPADNTFNFPFQTGINVGYNFDPYGQFEVLELEGFTEISETLLVTEYDEFQLGEFFFKEVLYVVGRRTTGSQPTSPYTRLYRIENMPDNTVSITIPFVIRPNNDDIIALFFNRSTIVTPPGNFFGNSLIFRARNTDDQRKLFRWNFEMQELTQISDVNPGGEDLPESIHALDTSRILFTAVKPNFTLDNPTLDPVLYDRWLYVYDVNTNVTRVVGDLDRPGIGLLVNAHDFTNRYFIADELSLEPATFGQYKRRLFELSIIPDPETGTSIDSPFLIERVVLPDDVSPQGNFNFSTLLPSEKINPYPPYDTLANFKRPSTIVSTPIGTNILSEIIPDQNNNPVQKYYTIWYEQLPLIGNTPEGGNIVRHIDEYFTTPIFTTISRNFEQLNGRYFSIMAGNSNVGLYRRQNDSDLTDGILPPEIVPNLVADTQIDNSLVVGAFLSGTYTGAGIINPATFSLVRADSIPLVAQNDTSGGLYYAKLGDWLYISAYQASQPATNLWRINLNPTSPFYEDGFGVFNFLDYSEGTSNNFGVISDDTKNIVQYGNKVFFTSKDELNNTRLFYVKFPYFD